MRHAECVLHEVISLANELHVSVLDAVVDHLDEVTTAALAHPVAAGILPDLGADGLEDGLDGGPGPRVAAGHQTRPVPRSLLSSGHTRAHEEDALVLQILDPPDRVLVLGVAPVDDDVPLLEERHQLL